MGDSARGRPRSRLARGAALTLFPWQREGSLRVPTKPAMHSNLKPAGYSDRKATLASIAWVDLMMSLGDEKVK
jgi:hypothetical protein